MKKNLIILGVVGVAIVVGLVIWQTNKPTKNTVTQPASSSSTSQTLPTQTNPIQNNSQTVGLTITEAHVEDNVDPSTNKAIADRLQLSLKNTSNQTMTGLEVYYQMKDAKTGQTEAYHQKLDGLTIAPNQTKTVYFDNQSGDGHYPENKYSLYRSSKNQVDFTIQVSAPGFKIAATTTTKSPGTGETPD